MVSPSTPSEKPGGQSPSDLLDLSQRALQLSFQRLTAGDYRQAADNVEKAVNLAAEAIATQRGWQAHSRATRHALVSQIRAEMGTAAAMASALHNGWAAANAIPHDGSHPADYSDIIDEALDEADAFVQAIKQLMDKPPSPFTVNSDSHAHRIYQLTGHRPAIGATDALGFTNFTGELREE